MWGIGAVPNDPAVFVSIEAEVDETADEVSGLRVASAYNPLDGPRDGIWRAGVVPVRIAQEGVQVARCGIADAQDQRVLGGVLENVLGRRIEAVSYAELRGVGSPRKRRRRAIGKGPIGGRNAHCARGGGGTASQARIGGIESQGTLISQADVSRGAEIDRIRVRRQVDQALDDGAGDWRTVVVLGHWNDDGLGVGAWQQIALPSADQADVTRRGTGGCPVSAIWHEIVEHAAGFRHVDGLGKQEGPGILHHATRVARRELDVVDHGVAGILGVEFAIEMAGECFVLAGLAEGPCAVSGRLASFHRDSRYAGAQGKRYKEEAGNAEEHGDIIRASRQPGLRGAISGRRAAGRAMRPRGRRAT